MKGPSSKLVLQIILHTCNVVIIWRQILKLIQMFIRVFDKATIWIFKLFDANFIKLSLINFICTELWGELIVSECLIAMWMLNWFCFSENNTYSLHRVSWKEQDTFCIFPGRVNGSMKFKCWLQDSQVGVSCFDDISLVVNFQNWRCCHFTE